ncbi:MAG: ROK family protein [Lachnospiraceae bacterium]
MYLGINVSRDAIRYAVYGQEFEEIEKWKKDMKEFESSAQFYDYICEELDETGATIIGISVPGIVRDSCVIAKSELKYLYKTNIKEEVEKRTEITTHAINDAKASGYCEFQMGNGKGTKSSAYFIIGDTLGGCICDEKGIVQGKDGLAGEFSVIPFGNTFSGKPDILTNYASMDALVNIYKEFSDRETTKGVQVVRRYLQGEQNAAHAMDAWMQNICYGLYEVMMMYNTDVICLGGQISEEIWFVDFIEKRFNEYRFLFHDVLTTKILQCKFRNSASLLGAVLYAKDKEETSK